ncbi:MAG: hypothetical protein LBM61_02535 [Prevotellaceae bacterium]|jgi:hypothetical protein|nr:hypothetical protein [Prevotellaceae bacterium]
MQVASEDILKDFEEVLINALRDLATRANRITDIIDGCIDNDLIDDYFSSECDGYYIEFDGMECPIRYPIGGEAGLEQWSKIAEAAPKIYYSRPSETKKYDTCYYMRKPNGMPLWFYIEDCIETLREVCNNVDTELLYCRRFTFNANLHCFKHTAEWIA